MMRPADCGRGSGLFGSMRIATVDSPNKAAASGFLAALSCWGVILF